MGGGALINPPCRLNSTWCLLESMHGHLWVLVLIIPKLSAWYRTGVTADDDVTSCILKNETALHGRLIRASLAKSRKPPYQNFTSQAFWNFQTPLKKRMKIYQVWFFAVLLSYTRQKYSEANLLSSELSEKWRFWFLSLLEPKQKRLWNQEAEWNTNSSGTTLGE